MDAAQADQKLLEEAAQAEPRAEHEDLVDGLTESLIDLAEANFGERAYVRAYSLKFQVRANTSVTVTVTE